MRKRRPALDDSQLGFTFAVPRPARQEAELAGFDRLLASTVARILKEDTRSRDEIAGAMSALLSEQVTKLMLDAYASEAREQHNIPAHRFLALIAVTDRHDLLDIITRRIGAAVIVGEEIITAEIGHLDRQIAALRDRKRAIETKANPIGRGR